MGEVSNACKFLVGRSERKRTFRRPRHRWKGNIKMVVDDEGWESKAGVNL